MRPRLGFRHVVLAEHCLRASKSEEDENLDNMKEWFKKMYYEKDYQGVSQDYFIDVISTSPDYDIYTGGKKVGSVNTADEQLKVVRGIATKKMKITDQDKQLDIEEGGGE